MQHKIARLLRYKLKSKSCRWDEMSKNRVRRLSYLIIFCSYNQCFAVIRWFCAVVNSENGQ